MNKNLKLIMACIYILCIGILLFIVFSYLDFKDLTSYTYIRDNTRLLIDLKNENLILFIVIFFGSSKIPDLARTLGKTIREVKDASNEIKKEIRDSASEVKDDLDMKK